MDKAKNLITYDLSFQYPHCVKVYGEPYTSRSRICRDCERGSGEGDKVLVGGNGKREIRLALENGGWVLKR